MRVPILVLALAACGGGKAFDDAAVPIDASARNDAPPACTTQLAGPSYGDVGALDGGASESADHANKFWSAALPGQSTLPDLLDVELWAGYGVFTAGTDNPGGDVQPGTYTIAGAEAQYATCGTCVLVDADFDTGTATAAQTYLATGGTITVTEVTDGVVGTVDNLHLVHVDIDSTSSTSTQVDTCAIDLAHASFAAYFPEAECSDGVDNDHDTLIDCADSDCAQDPHCLPETNCSNGIDDDGDGFTDCLDSDCAQDPHCLPETNCTDGIDNDTDGYTDCVDPDCFADPACIAQPDGGIPDGGPSDAAPTPDGTPPPPPDAGAPID